MAESVLNWSPLTPVFGARVEGVDLRRLDDATFAAIRDLFDERSVLVFPTQDMDDETQIAFSERFGPLERTISANPAAGTAFARQSNIDTGSGGLIPADDRRMIYQKANEMWHTDSSYKPVPSLCSILSGREVPPEGGATEFASGRAAWDALPEDMRREIEGRIAIHSLVYSRGLISDAALTDAMRQELPAVRQVLVRENPANGRKALFIGAHASHIEGMPEEEGRTLLRRLEALITQPEFTYSHQWAQGDVLVWDNRCILHRATPYDAARHRRLMQRTTVEGTGPTVEPALAA